MRSALLSLTLAAPLVAGAQSYHVPETEIVFFKSTSFGPVHGYLEVINDTGDSLPMRWVCRWDTQCSPEWYFNFDDQNNFYAPVIHLDSADFTLYPPESFPLKLIIGLQHKQVADTGSIFFTIFPLSNRSDSTVITYTFNIARGAPVDTTDTASGIFPVHRMNTDWLRLHEQGWEVTKPMDMVEAWAADGTRVGLWYNIRPGVVLTPPQLKGLVVFRGCASAQWFWAKGVIP